MSTFDQASLVMIPSGYKTSKVYSVKPTDGSGDLAFTRSNDTATRVNSAGLIEKVRTNLILQSQDFTTSWATNASPTITANTTVAPDGTTTADTIASSGASSGAYQVPTVASGVEHSFSVYIKNITTATNLQIGCDLGPINGFLNFNAVTGAITSTAAGITGSSVTSVGNGWYRVSGTYVSTGTTNTFVIFGQASMTFAVWGAQLETGVTTAYIATTSAAVSVGPVANVPRLDYLNSSCPRLLLEPQRTNSLTYSEQFNNAAWSKDAVSVSANASTSPDGYVNADSIVENSATGFHFIQQTFTSSAVSTTYSIFAKLGSGTRTLILREGVNTGAFAAFNLSTGVVAAQSGGTATITQYANGYYRCTLTFTAVAGTSSMQIALSNGNSFASYAGNGTSSIIVYGAQIEAGAYATSYIPTLGAAVTRGADACSKTGISSLIGQTEGTAFVEYKKTHAVEAGGQILILLADNSNPAATRLQVVLENDYAFLYVVSGSTLLAQSSNITIPNGVNKIAFSYGANGYKFYINGVQQFSNSTTTVPATQNLFIGNYTASTAYMSDSIAQALLFKTQLPNAQLAELTTL